MQTSDKVNLAKKIFFFYLLPKEYSKKILKKLNNSTSRFTDAMNDEIRDMSILLENDSENPRYASAFFSLYNRIAYFSFRKDLIDLFLSKQGIQGYINYLFSATKPTLEDLLRAYNHLNKKV